MELTIIVVSVGNPLLIRRFFDSLSVQTCKNFSVLFVYAPTFAEATVKNICLSYPDMLITPLPSNDCCLSRSRNLALKSVKGDIVAISDDDCAYEPDTIEKVLYIFRKNEKIAVLMGRSLGYQEPIPSSEPSLSPLNKYSLFKGCPSYVHFYRAKVVKTIGCFDEELGVGCSTPYQSGEETDYALRALDAGFCAARASSVIVRHPSEFLLNQHIVNKTARYAAGRMQLLAKHKFPTWFVVANVFYPLLRLPLECFSKNFHVAKYRWAMFKGRLTWLLRLW